MKQSADFVIVFLVVFIILAVRRILRFWFGSHQGVKTKVPQKTTSEETAPSAGITINHNTMNILIMKENI